VILIRKPDIAYITLFLTADGVLLEDAVRESATKVERVRSALQTTYREIRDVHIQDVHLGEAKLAMGFQRDKANPPRPEVVKSVLITIPADPLLAVKIVDTAVRLGCTMSASTGAFGPPQPSVILYGLSEPADAEQEAVTRAINEAKEKASRIARMMERRIGTVQSISAMENLISIALPGEIKRVRDTFRLTKYLSFSSDRVEVPGRISLTFELLD
jgi:uncharacterized protein YggE